MKGFYHWYQSLVDNKAADALSHMATILHTMTVQVTRFDPIKTEYSSCPDFGIIFHEVSNGNHRECVNFITRDGSCFEEHNYVSPILLSVNSLFGNYMVAASLDILAKIKLLPLWKIVSIGCS